MPTDPPCAITRPGPFRFLALGDSYTIGESVAESERWPVQLADQLRAGGVNIQPPEIIARTGWTTSELNRAIDEVDPHGPYDLVSLLIGVNNQYRGYPQENYRAEFAVLLDRAVGFAGSDPRKVLVLSIPDWGMTPFGERDGRDTISAEIDAFNAINRQISKERGVRYIDITPISRLSIDGLVANDDLHPSGKQYGMWVDLTLPEACEALQ